MTAVDVDALDELREAATAGPWQVETVEGRADVLAPGRFSRMLAFDIDRADAALIVAAVNALPGLLAEVRRGRALREEHDELRGRLKALVGEWDAMARNLHHIPVAEAYADVVIGLRAVLAAVDANP